MVNDKRWENDAYGRFERHTHAADFVTNRRNERHRSSPSIFRPNVTANRKWTDGGVHLLVSSDVPAGSSVRCGVGRLRSRIDTRAVVKNPR